MAEGGVPKSILRILGSEGIFIPDSVTDDQREVFGYAQDGQCMTCRAPLGQGTVIVVIKQGVVGVFCGGKCLSDMQVIGWLKEQHDDLQDRIAFRGGDVDADAMEEEDGSD